MRDFSSETAMLDVESIRNTIVNGDCLEVMRQLPDGCIDLAVTSPPYNLKKPPPTSRWKSRPLANGYNGYDDSMAHGDYVAWQRDVIAETLRVLNDDGALYYNHKFHIRKGMLIDYHEIIDGFPVRQVIIWQRAGGLNFNNSHFLSTYEVIYLIAKKNYHIVSGANRLTDIWRINQEMHNSHPAPFPVDLPKRAIASSLSMEREGAIVLDPFMGSGTTAVAAVMLGKDYIGIEQSAEYCEMARKRIEETRSLGGELGF